MRADRLISLIMLLQSRNGLTARQLAEELEVSERTIYRDLVSLSSAGIPVYTRGGPGGGCFLVEEYRTTLTGMTPDQTRALFALSIPAPLSQLGLSQDLKGALLKLSAALPSALRGEEERNRQRLFLDWGYDSISTEESHMLKLVQSCVWQDFCLKLRYRSHYSSWIEPLDQVVEPYSLVAWAGDWYLVGFWDGAGHIIRLNLIEEAQMINETFTRKSDYNLPVFWSEWRHNFEADKPHFHVKVRVSPNMTAFLRHFQEDFTDERGWVTGRLTFDSFERARARLLSWGGAVEVVEPEALRCNISDYAKQILLVYKELEE